MTKNDRWMRWELKKRADRATKRPITVAGASASSTNAETWSSFAAANRSKVGAGIGYALGSGIGCIDLDHCIVDGELQPWAADILSACPDTFIEVSQSGSGLHIFGLLAESHGRNIRRGETAIEVYSTGRFIAMTGKRFKDSPARLADISELVKSII